MPRPPWHPFRSPQARARYLAEYDRQAALWPVPARTLDVSTDAGTTHVRISGPDHLPPLVLLPGMGATSMMYASLVPGLCGARRVLTPDNVYDYGRSVNARPFRKGRDYVAWLEGLLDALGVREPFDLMGTSYGAWIAAEFALARPARLRRLVLMSPASTIAHMRPGFMLRALLSNLPLRACTRSFMSVLASGLAKREGGAALVETMAEDAFLAARSFRSRIPVPPRVLPDADLARLAASVPTLYLAGSADPVFDAARALGRLRRVAPSIQAEVFHGMGHDLFITGADMVAPSVVAFLDGE